jgi:hypothetical protein
MSNTISDARLQANIANAQLSTGPRTPEGKAASAANSRTHGLCAKDLVILPGEQEEFDQLLGGHIKELKPDNVIEETLFDELVLAAWNLRRVRRLQAAVQEGVDPVAALDDEVLQKKLERLARHRTRIERSYHKSMKELRALQTERHNRPTMAPEFPTSISPLVDSTQISKRTQAEQKTVRKTRQSMPSNYETSIYDSQKYFPTRRRKILQNEPKAALSSQPPKGC